MSIKTQRAEASTGSIVAFRKGPTPTWYEIVGADGMDILVREAGTAYAAQWSDRSLIEQIKTAA